MLDDEDINQIAQKVAQILSTEQPTEPTHAWNCSSRFAHTNYLGKQPFPKTEKIFRTSQMY